MKFQKPEWSGHGSVPEKWATFQIYCVQFGSESPILQPLLKQAMPQWTQLGRSYRFLPDNNKVSVHYGNFTIWWCHSELKLFWDRTKFGNIGTIMLIVSWRVFNVLTNMGYRGQIRDSKLKRLPSIYDHCGVTVVQTLVICHITTDKYTGIITD